MTKKGKMPLNLIPGCNHKYKKTTCHTKAVLISAVDKSIEH